MNYVGRVMAAFSVIKYSDIQLTESQDGQSVFAQMNGDFVVASSGDPYKNSFIMRLDTRLAEFCDHNLKP